MATQFSVDDGIPWKARFFTIWTVQALSLIGSQLVQFALVWYITVQTGSATVLAIATLIATLPRIVLGPFIGSLVDRWDRKRIMIFADLSVALATAILAVLFWLGIVEIWHIYLITFVRSVGGTFHGSAMGASTSLMVPIEHLTRVQGLNQMLNGGLNVIAAPLGALLIELMPTQNVLAIDFVTAIIAIVPLLFFAIPQPARQEAVEGVKTSMFDDMKAGFAYVASWPGMLALIGLAMVINLFLAPAGSLLPLLVREHFLAGAKELGWMEAALGLGAISGGILLGVWGGFKNKSVTSFLALIGMGVGFFGVGYMPSNAFWWAVAAMGLTGLMMPIVNGGIGAIMQVAVAPDMQGRVFSLLGSGAGLMMPIGLAIAGPAADLVGIQMPYMVGGIVCMAMGVAGFFFPAVMNLEADGIAKRKLHEVENGNGIQAEPVPAD